MIVQGKCQKKCQQPVRGTLVPEAFFYSLLANFATLTASFFFLLARSAESREKKASGQDHWEPHFHAISF